MIEFIRRSQRNMPFASALLMLIICESSWAASGAHRKAGTTGAAFLKIYPGARYEAQGGCGAADAAGADAVYWNPAGLAWTDRTTRQAAFAHNNYIADIDLNYLAYVSPTANNGVFGMSLLHLDGGDISRTEADAAGNPVTGIGDFTAQDLAFSAAYSTNMSRQSSWGINLKYIHSKLESEQAAAFALDAGLRFHMTENLSAGFVMQNFGTQIKFRRQSDKLPLNYKMGMAYRASLFSGDNNLRMAADLNMPQYDKIHYNIGMEWLIRRVFALRAGYDRRNTDFDEWLTAGFGLKFRSASFDYALTPQGDLNRAHRFGFKYIF